MIKFRYSKTNNNKDKRILFVEEEDVIMSFMKFIERNNKSRLLVLIAEYLYKKGRLENVRE